MTRRIAYRVTRDSQERAWAQVRLVRSNHDMWTLEVVVIASDGEPLHTEHMLVSASQIDNFMGAGVPVTNPLPVPKVLVKRK